MSSFGDTQTPEKNQDESETNASCTPLKWETTHSMFNGKLRLRDFLFKKRKADSTTLQLPKPHRAIGALL